MRSTGLWFEATSAAICLSEQWPIPGKSPIKFAVGTGPIPGMDRAIRRASIGSVLANTPLARENERTCAADTWRASKPVSFRACHTAYSYPPVGSRAIAVGVGVYRIGRKREACFAVVIAIMKVLLQAEHYSRIRVSLYDCGFRRFGTWSTKRTVSAHLDCKKLWV